ncbi:MAG: hypothetical protein JKY31_02695 [Rhodobacteraceae bacterium]|nr:hypothetical protein [Paracoccaceae bacterium]
MTDWTTAETYDVGGVSYGAGLDYLLGEHLFVGFEYLMRDMSGPRADDPNRIGHSAIQSAAVRVGWKF